MSWLFCVFLYRIAVSRTWLKILSTAQEIEQRDITQVLSPPQRPLSPREETGESEKNEERWKQDFMKVVAKGR